MANTTRPHKSLWVALAWSLPAIVLVFAFLAPEYHVALVVAAFFLGKEVLAYYWPDVEAWLRARGVPAWCFEDGWPSNVLTSGTLSFAFFLYLQWAGARFTWLDALPGIAQFAVIFAMLFAITWFAQAMRRHFKIP